MTNEKAIELLDNLIGMVEDNQENDYDTALKMGKESLKQEPCEDCISREVAIHTIMGQPPEVHHPDWYAKQIKELPSVKPQEPRRKGKWIYNETKHRYKCSLCTMENYENSNFCPNCGADMREE